MKGFFFFLISNILDIFKSCFFYLFVFYADILNFLTKSSPYLIYSAELYGLFMQVLRELSGKSKWISVYLIQFVNKYCISFAQYKVTQYICKYLSVYLFVIFHPFIHPSICPFIHWSIFYLCKFWGRRFYRTYQSWSNQER